MKNGKILILILISVLVGIGLLKVRFDTQRKMENLMKIPNFESEVKAESQVKLIIEEDITEKWVKIESEQTVFDLLEESGLDFEYEQYESGAFITSIEGVSDPVKNWMYYVNGVMGRKAVDQGKIRNGDIVKFKHQKSPF